MRIATDGRELLEHRLSSMRAFRLLGLSCLLAGLAIVAFGQDNPVLIGMVSKVTDGDTITVEISSGPITVRFDSIDAPERNQPWGREATAALARLIDGKEVALDPVSQDRYERIVAAVYLEDLNVNAWMVNQGHAWAYRQYAKDENYCNWESSARSSGRGLWSMPADNWVSPWSWRSANRHSDYADETAADCIAAMGRTPQRGKSAPSTRASRSDSASVIGCRIKGNIGDSGRIYHIPGSSSYVATKIDEHKGERWFCTEAEARAAGWRPPRG